ncbi:uncharacterized protein LOC134228140 [Armigeres subalbatus]|uniref:uncharacterized protein LOC134228140 n=1 Tax=Armigeres subalbatus TaxID=124917 RepID=UPI002ED1BDFD
MAMKIFLSSMSGKKNHEPKNKQGKNQHHNDESIVQQCILNVKTGRQTIYGASKSFGIPESTIRYRLSDKWTQKTRKGPSTVLSSEEEEKLVAWLKDRQQRGIPVVKETLYSKVKSFFDAKACFTPKPNPFRNNRPGRKWFNSFLKRNKSITLRTPEAVSAASAKVSEADIRGWFDKVYTYFEERGLSEILQDPSRVYNGDETSFFLHPKTKAVLAARESRNVYEVEHANSHLNITVMFSFAADGSIVPPDVILPMKRLRTDLLRTFPADWGVGKSAKGWMDADNFALYIQKVFYHFLLKKGVTFPVIYFVDGHSSHMAAEVADLCLELEIFLVVLYPNTTRITQPADVGIFKPLKNAWKAAVSEWHDTHNGEILSLDHFGPVLQEAMKRGILASSVINGFRACGLYPFNADNIDYSKCIAKSAASAINQEVSVETPVPIASPSSTSLPAQVSDNLIAHPSYITDSVIIPFTTIKQVLKDIGEERLRKITTCLELNSDEIVIKTIFEKLLRPFHSRLSHMTQPHDDVSVPVNLSDYDDNQPSLTAEQIQNMPGN